MTKATAVGEKYHEIIIPLDEEPDDLSPEEYFKLTNSLVTMVMYYGEEWEEELEAMDQVSK